MLTATDLAAIRARLDAIPRWKISPRDIYTCRRVDAGEDALAIAREEVTSGHDGWLGWELAPPLDEAGRGLTPTQAVQLVDMRADLEALLAEVERLRADCDEMQRAAERAAAAENANAADLATVKAERDEARAIVNACIGACPVTTVAFAGDVPTYIRACFDAVVAERDELAATLVRASVFEQSPASEANMNPIRVERVAGDHGVRWAVRWLGNALGRDGKWDYEPFPSSRPPGWTDAHRFASFGEAMREADRAAGGGK